MSEASIRNLGTSMRERDRRIGMSLASPGTPGLAQAAYLMPQWDAFYGSQREQAGPGGYRLSGAGMSLDGDPQGSTQRPGDDDIARTLIINRHLSQLADENKVRVQADKDVAAHNDAQAQAVRDRQAMERAAAIANTPGASAAGKPIVGGNGSYATQDAPQGNPQQIAAQMAPGLIAPPAPAPPVTFGPPVKATITVDGKPKNVFVRTGSDGLTYDMGRKPVDPASLEPPGEPGAGNTNVSDVVKGMMAGTLPPQLPGRASKEYIALQAEAQRQGYNLAEAATDWNATQKHVQTMNGAQQLRLNQAVNALPEMLDSVDSLASQWKGGKFPMLNKASLSLAKGGAYGPEAASIANQLDAQIADVTADLGNVYMGGNSPTDHALSLAGKSLKGEWDEKVLHDMVALAKKNVQIRRNSISNTGVAGASANNPYDGQGAAPAQAGALPPLSAGEVYATDPQGNVHKGKAGANLPPGWKLGGG